MSNLFKVSQSKLKVYRRCKRAYWNKYVEKLKRKRVGRPLQFGRMVHEMIEEYANGRDPMKYLDKIAKRDEKMFKSQREELGNIVGDVRTIMGEYFDYWESVPEGKRIKYMKLNGKSAEHTFEVEISDGIVATGKIDNFAVTPNKLKWLTEHKSGARIPNEDHRWRSLQSAMYLRIADMLGLPSLDGTLWDYIRSKPPTRPQILKGGQLSARGLDTLPTVVFDAMKEAKLKLGDPKYKGLIKQADQNRSAYFQRVFSPVKKKVVDILFNDFVHTAREMADHHGDPKHSEMNIDRHCEWCEYEPLCRALLQGLDVDFIIAKEYEKREKYIEEEPDFEA